MPDLRPPVRTLIASSLAAVLAAAAAPALAQEADANAKFKLSGFVSLVAGRVTGAVLADDYIGPEAIDGVPCPCYIADWGNAGVYRNSWSFKPESRAGIQAKYTVSPEFNMVAQLVTRGSDTKPSLQWAYASYAPSKAWEFQLGRKRIPLYFYSDFQDVGVAYPWVAVPPELYGWETTNYNGASARYKSALGDANLTASMFAGKETDKDARYQRLYYEGKTKVTWSKLIGGDLELTKGALTTRAVSMQADVHMTNPIVELDDKAALRAYGVAANFDFDEWFVLTEATQLSRQFEVGYKVTAPAFTVGAGYHWGPWTPFLNYASYKEKTDDLEVYAPQSYKRVSATLRYDLGTKAALKAQVDRQRDATRNFGGNGTIVRVSYDRVF